MKLWLPSLSITVLWFIASVSFGLFPRVFEHFASMLTMVLGSFVAGATPQGGGAVAFPVFTKGLGVPSEVARSFSLCIQAVGMTVAAFTILVAKRTVEWRAIGIAVPMGIAGLFFALFGLSDADTLFWSSLIPPAYVKVTFTIILAAMAYVVFLSLNQKRFGTQRIQEWNGRIVVGMMISGMVGGVLSGLTGSGLDVFLFLFSVVVCGLHPRVGIPTSIVAMAMLSTVGAIVLGLVHGQLFVDLNELRQVVSVGSRNTTPLPGEKYDLFGLWLAAVPVVVWGAPLGSYFVQKLSEVRLVLFVSCMAAIEVVTTVVFLEPLRRDPWLIAFSVVGLFGTIGVAKWLSTHQSSVVGDLH